MDEKLIIRIKKQSQTELMINSLFLLPFIFGFFIEVLHLPGVVKYFCDILWMLLLVMLLSRANKFDNHAARLFLFVVAFFAVTSLCYLVNFQSPLFYLWGIRNNFRFYAAFFAVVQFANARMVNKAVEFLDKAFWVNFGVCIVQFFFLGISGDYLGGIFGSQEGSNAYMNVFLTLCISKTLVLCFDKKEKTNFCLAKCVISLYIAALSEMKFFFVEFVLILLMAIIITDFSWRKLWIVVGAVAGISACVGILSAYFSDGLRWFTLKWFWDTAVSSNGYTSSGDLNRLNAIPVINELWLKTLGQQLIGLGLGNCETSTFAFLNTPFFQKNGDMHYSWLSYAFVYLECGWIGLLFFFGFFVLVYQRISKINKQGGSHVCTYCRIALIMAIMCMIISVYNSSLRTEAGYMAYFTLASPFVLRREQIDEQKAERKCTYV